MSGGEGRTSPSRFLHQAAGTPRTPAHGASCRRQRSVTGPGPDSVKVAGPDPDPGPWLEEQPDVSDSSELGGGVPGLAWLPTTGSGHTLNGDPVNGLVNGLPSSTPTPFIFFFIMFISFSSLAGETQSRVACQLDATPVPPLGDRHWVTAPLTHLLTLLSAIFLAACAS